MFGKLTDLSKSVKWRPRIGFTTLRRDMWQYVTETATERRKIMKRTEQTRH